MGGKAYDPLTASLMIPGLADCASWLDGGQVSAVRTACGRLAIFDPAVSTKALLSRMEEPATARPLLEKQLEMYRFLFPAWREERARSGDWVEGLRRAAELLRRFFAVLLPLHETYDAILARCVREIHGRPGSGDSLLVTATPSILQWQMEQQLPLSSAKSIFERGGEVPVAPSTIDADLRDTQARMIRALGERADGVISWATHLAWVMVLKEWKFYLAKALHRHFGGTLRAAAPTVPETTLASMPFDALLATLGGEG